jgi:hypothetical protein
MWWAHLEAFYCHDAFAKTPIEAVELLMKGWENFNRNSPDSVNFARDMVVSGDISVREIDYGMCISESGFDMIRNKEVEIISTRNPMFKEMITRLMKELELDN